MKSLEWACRFILPVMDVERVEADGEVGPLDLTLIYSPPRGVTLKSRIAE